MLLILDSADTGSQGGDLPGFLLLGLLWLGPSMALGGWMMRAQLEYVRRYRAVRGVDLPLPGEHQALLAGPGLSWRLWKIVWEPQPEPELEQARQRVVYCWWLSAAYVFFGWVIASIIVGVLCALLRC